MKKAISLLLSIVMLLSIIAGLDLSASAATSGDFQYTVLSNGTAQIQKYTGSATDLIIPETIDGYTVSAIGAYAFEYNKSVTSVTIPDSVIGIGEQAFIGCSNLISITIPDSVTSIAAAAFYACKSLTSVTISESVIFIGSRVFDDCTNLKDITILYRGCYIDDSQYTISDTATIYGYSNSTAQAYAEKYGRTFVALDDEKAEFTVVFTDRYGNIFSTQTVTDGADIVIPDAPVITGYTFIGWSVTNEEIAALTTNTIIQAQYEKMTEQTYTITANGATITTENTVAKDKLTDISYDTKVTVTAAGATAWKIDNVTVAYGESYTFYVGADVELTFETGAVTETPVVASVSATEIGTEGDLKASFLATRSMVGGYTYVNAGFIYAINPADNYLTLADVNQDTVRAQYCTTDSEQFCLNIGRVDQTGTIVARAFLAYVDSKGDGATQIVYAEPQSYTYK